MSPNPFYSPRRRVQRAREQLLKLAREQKRFFATTRYAQVAVPDPVDAGYTIHKVVLTERIPDVLADLTAEVADGLRSALDQACYAVAVAASGGEPKRTHFPFSNSHAEVVAALANGNSKHIPAALHPYLTGLKPFKGGNPLLWALNRMRNTSQHRFITAIGMYTGGNISHIFIERSGPKGQFLFPPQWDTEKNEMIIMKSLSAFPPSFDMEVTFEIAFGDLDLVEGKPVIPILERMANKVASVLDGIAAEARRAGIV